MCCCYVDQCCCGCTSHNTGVMIWAIIDALLNLAYFVMGLQSIGVGGPHLWSLLVIIADILLAIGAHTSNTGLMIFWLVVMMISIILLFIGLLLVIIAVLVGAAWLGAVQSAGCNDVEKALSGHGFNTNAAGCDEVVGIGSGILIGTAIVAFILPVVSIYFWIVVNSLRKRILESRAMVMPMIIQQPAFVNQGPMVQFQQPITTAPPPGYNMDPGYDPEKY